MQIIDISSCAVRIIIQMQWDYEHPKLLTTLSFMQHAVRWSQFELPGACLTAVFLHSSRISCTLVCEKSVTPNLCLRIRLSDTSTFVRIPEEIVEISEIDRRPKLALEWAHTFGV